MAAASHLPRHPGLRVLRLRLVLRGYQSPLFQRSDSSKHSAPLAGVAALSASRGAGVGLLLPNPNGVFRSGSHIPVCPSIGRSGGTGVDSWVVEVLRFGYCIPFLKVPPLSKEPIPMASPVVHQGDSPGGLGYSLSGRERGAVELAPFPSGFYSRMFVVWKTSGSWRPVIDLSVLNRSIAKIAFMMETIQSVLLSVRQGNWMVSIDVKEAYLQVPSLPGSCKYLRFVAFGKPYQFRALCFGLSTLCQELGIVVNPAKFNFVPAQRVQYLGTVLDALTFRASPSQERIDKLISPGEEFLSSRLQPASTWQALLGTLLSLPSRSGGSPSHASSSAHSPSLVGSPGRLLPRLLVGSLSPGFAMVAGSGMSSSRGVPGSALPRPRLGQTRPMWAGELTWVPTLFRASALGRRLLC